MPQTLETSDQKTSLKPRVVLVAEHASATFGGEAALPLHYFRVLLNRNIPVILVTHTRVQAELNTLFPNDASRIIFVADSTFNKLMWMLGNWLPARVAYATTGWLSRISTQIRTKAVVQELVTLGLVDVIHQPMPVSPKEPSFMYGFGVPVVIGPMNGGMDFPPAFRKKESGWVRKIVGGGRFASGYLNKLIPGKIKADVLLVANERTKHALPKGHVGKVALLVENGVDLPLWQPVARFRVDDRRPCAFFFMGRLISLKAVDILLEAYKRAAQQVPCTLTIIGDGPEGGRLKEHARKLNILGVSDRRIVGKVQFLGWLAQADCAKHLNEADALVLPSLMECGGAVVLEAMSAGLPVIATDWGGPADYLDDSCGVLVAPASRAAFVDGLSAAMIRLASSRELRHAMGEAGQRKVSALYDWDKKVDVMLDIYRSAIQRRSSL